MCVLGDQELPLVGVGPTYTGPPVMPGRFAGQCLFSKEPMNAQGDILLPAIGSGGGGLGIDVIGV